MSMKFSLDSSVHISKTKNAMINKSICWVTPDYFLDTDAYVMRYLPDYFHIHWIITKKKESQLSYSWLIDEINKKSNIRIEIYELDGKSYGLKGLRYFLKLQEKTKYADIVYRPSGFLYTLPLMILLGNKRNTIVPIHNVRTPKGGSWYFVNKIYTGVAVKYFNLC